MTPDSCKVRVFTLDPDSYTFTVSSNLLHLNQQIWAPSFPLTLSLLVTKQEDFVDSVDQDQTAQNVQSDL